MKYNTLRSFRKHLDSAFPAHIPSIYFLLVEDDSLRSYAIGCVIQAFRKAGFGKEVIKRFEKDQVARFVSEMSSASLFASKGAYLLSDVDALKIDTLRQLERHLSPSQNEHLVFVGSKLNASTSFYKKGEKEGVVFEVGELKAWEKEKMLAEWLEEALNLAKKQASPAVAKEWVQRSGGDLLHLSSEFDKVITYVGERPVIAKADIEAVGVSLESDTFWQFTDALFTGQGHAAAAIGFRLLSSFSLIPLLKQLRTQLQTLLEIQGYLDSRSSSEELSKAFPQLRGGLLDMQVKRCQKMGGKKIHEAILYLDELELKAKNSRADEETLFTLALTKLAI